MSPESNADLDRIYLEIAEAGFPDNAYSFTDKIAAFCQELRYFPHRGTARTRLVPGLRTIGFRRQVTIAFHVLEQEQLVIVDRILEKGRSLEEAFRRNP